MVFLNIFRNVESGLSISMTHNLSLETTSSHSYLIDSSNKNCIFSTKTELIKADKRHQISQQSTCHQKMKVIFDVSVPTF